MKETKLKIHTWPDKILRKKCQPVKKVTDQVRSLLDQMYILMKLKEGVGLAANQAGLDLRLIVAETEEGIFKLIDPKIVKKEGCVNFEEGCLSFPGILINVKRAEKVWVTSLDEKGNSFDIEAKGVLAVVLQHEIDHINGVVFIERIPFLKRIQLRGKLKNIKRGKAK